MISDSSYPPNAVPSSNSQFQPPPLPSLPIQLAHRIELIWFELIVDELLYFFNRMYLYAACFLCKCLKIKMNKSIFESLSNKMEKNSKTSKITKKTIFSLCNVNVKAYQLIIKVIITRQRVVGWNLVLILTNNRIRFSGLSWNNLKLMNDKDLRRREHQRWRHEQVGQVFWQPTDLNLAHLNYYTNLQIQTEFLSRNFKILGTSISEFLRIIGSSILLFF